MKPRYWRVPTEMPAVGITVISTLSTFWLGMSSLASPFDAVAAVAKYMPSARFGSVLRTSTLLRPVRVGGRSPARTRPGIPERVAERRQHLPRPVVPHDPEVRALD